MAQEYVVRVPREIKKHFNVMRFNAALNMDVTKFKHCKMEREVMFKDVKPEIEDERPEFGEGSEFGRKEREEARRRKYQKRKHKSENSPWIMKVGGKQGKKFKGIREGGVTENTAYYVFFQAPDGAFEAFPVNEWYNFTPFQRYKALSAEEAEEKFNKRDQILNYFQVRHLGKKEGEGSTVEPKIKSERAIKKEFKVSDMDDWDNSDDNLSAGDSDEEDRKPDKEKLKGKGKGKKEKKEKRKKDDSENDDEEPGEDSDEGDYDDKEVDYMSASSSSSDSETEKGDIKGVVEEAALRDLVVSEDEDEEAEQKEENAQQNEENKPNEAELKVKVKSENGNDSSISDSDFDSDNPDDEVIPSKSALLIQNKKEQKIKSESSASEAKPKEGNSSESSKSGGHSNGLKFKHKLEDPGPGHSNKRQKLEKSRNEPSDGVTEDAVRRYLMRKPMTCTDLLQKFKNKVQERDNLVQKIAQILKKLDPQTQKLNGKMYFSLKPT